MNGGGDRILVTGGTGFVGGLGLSALGLTATYLEHPGFRR